MGNLTGTHNGSREHHLFCLYLPILAPIPRTVALRYSTCELIASNSHLLHVLEEPHPPVQRAGEFVVLNMEHPYMGVHGMGLWVQGAGESFHVNHHSEYC